MFGKDIKWPIDAATFIRLNAKLPYMRKRIKTLKARMARDQAELRHLESLESQGARVHEIRDGIPLGGGFRGVTNLGMPTSQTRFFETYLNAHTKKTWCLKLGHKDTAGFPRDSLWRTNYTTEADADRDGYFWVLTGLKPDHYEKEFAKNLKGITE